MTEATLTDTQLPDREISHPKLLFAAVKGTPLLTAAAIGVGCLYVGLNNPETKQILPPCGFYLTTGFYCPGCGMTRALHSFLHGDILRAIQFNAVLVAVIPFLMYFYVWWMTWAFTGKELPKIKASKQMTWAIVGLVVLVVVGRNFPGPVAEYFSRGRV